MVTCSAALMSRPSAPCTWPLNDSTVLSGPAPRIVTFDLLRLSERLKVHLPAGSSITSPAFASISCVCSFLWKSASDWLTLRRLLAAARRDATRATSQNAIRMVDPLVILASLIYRWRTACGG